jgi:phage tail sheath protein FI
MAFGTYPGVYVKEVSSGVRPIQAAGTSTAAFFGVVERGPIGEVRQIFNFTQFKTTYGGFLRDHYLAYAVYQFFNNGGTKCYVGRVANKPVTAYTTIKDCYKEEQNRLDTIKVEASSPGVWGKDLRILIESDANKPNVFTLKVFQYRAGIDDEPRELEVFTNLSMNPASPSFVENVINSQSLNIRVKVQENSHVIAGYSESGEIDITKDSLLEPGQREFFINIHGDGYKKVTLPATIGVENKPKLKDIKTAILNAIKTLQPTHASTPEEAYAVTVNSPNDIANKIRITSGHASEDSSIEILEADNKDVDAAAPLKLGRKFGTEVYGSSILRPADTPQEGTILDPEALYKMEDGDDGSPPTKDDYINALKWLDTIQDVSLISIPGIGLPDVADEGMNYCRNRPLSDCFFIADMAITDDTKESAEKYSELINIPNSYGAVYFPWLKMSDPTGVSNKPILVPPSGFVAGLYARIDANRGVWKAPAGTEAMVAGAVGLSCELTDPQHGDLNTPANSKSVCVIRKFPSSGIVLWGARTLSSDAEYKYIPVRRMAIMLRKSIYNGIQWAVFEPNDEGLWSQLRLNIGSFMMTLFRRGAFQGSTPSQAFFVKCDSETTTQDDINLGNVNVLIGFAPLKPAEFVIVKISQKAGQVS